MHMSLYPLQSVKETSFWVPESSAQCRSADCHLTLKWSFFFSCNAHWGFYRSDRIHTESLKESFSLHSCLTHSCTAAWWRSWAVLHAAASPASCFHNRMWSTHPLQLKEAERLHVFKSSSTFYSFFIFISNPLLKMQILPGTGFGLQQTEAAVGRVSSEQLLSGHVCWSGTFALTHLHFDQSSCGLHPRMTEAIRLQLHVGFDLFTTDALLGTKDFLPLKWSNIIYTV